MSDLSVILDLITKQTEDLLWDTLPSRLSLDMNLASHISATVLVGKIIGLKPPGKLVIINTILAVWKFAVHLRIEAMENSTYLFHFTRSRDRDKVLLMVPWNFKGHLLVLQHWSSALTIAEIDLTTSSFWIQLHGLPMAGMNQPTISAIGSSIGQLLELDKLPEGITCKRFFRIKVKLNVCNPLKHGFFLPSPNLSDVFISFRYEKLSDFCYNCGRIGHTFSMCPHETMLEGDHQFGSWLRANLWDSSTLSVSSTIPRSTSLAVSASGSPPQSKGLCKIFF